LNSSEAGKDTGALPAFIQSFKMKLIGYTLGLLGVLLIFVSYSSNGFANKIEGIEDSKRAAAQQIIRLRNTVEDIDSATPGFDDVRIELYSMIANFDGLVDSVDFQVHLPLLSVFGWGSLVLGVLVLLIDGRLTRNSYTKRAAPILKKSSLLALVLGVSTVLLSLPIRGLPVKPSDLEDVYKSRIESGLSDLVQYIDRFEFMELGDKEILKKELVNTDHLSVEFSNRSHAVFSIDPIRITGLMITSVALGLAALYIGQSRRAAAHNRSLPTACGELDKPDK